MKCTAEALQHNHSNQREGGITRLNKLGDGIEATAFLTAFKWQKLCSIIFRV
jgi:hypothetical protein